MTDANTPAVPAEDVAAGQIWTSNNTAFPTTYRVMGVLENYVAFKHKGWNPNIVHINDFKRNHVRVK